MSYLRGYAELWTKKPNIGIERAETRDHRLSSHPSVWSWRTAETDHSFHNPVNSESSGSDFRSVSQFSFHSPTVAANIEDLVETINEAITPSELSSKKWNNSEKFIQPIRGFLNTKTEQTRQISNSLRDSPLFMGMVRHWVLALSVVAVAHLTANLFLLNLLVVYPQANHLLPVQYWANGTPPLNIVDADGKPLSTQTAKSSQKRPKRANDSPPNNRRQYWSFASSDQPVDTEEEPTTLRQSYWANRDRTTAATTKKYEWKPKQTSAPHPIPQPGPFLKPSPDPLTTRYTRRTRLPSHRSKILTNSRIPPTAPSYPKSEEKVTQRNEEKNGTNVLENAGKFGAIGAAAVAASRFGSADRSSTTTDWKSTASKGIATALNEDSESKEEDKKKEEEPAKEESNELSKSAKQTKSQIQEDVGKSPATERRFAPSADTKSSSRQSSEPEVRPATTFWSRDWAPIAVELLLFTAPGIGMLIGYVPLGIWLRAKGSRIVISKCLILSGLFVLLQPSAIKSGLVFIVVLRILHGITCAPLLPFIGANAAQWATLNEQLLFLTFSFAAIFIGPAVAWLLAATVVDTTANVGRIQIFHYILALSTILISLLWFLFYRDTPQKHRYVDGEEMNRIVTGKTVTQNRLSERSVVPLLLKSVSGWSLIVAAFGYFSVFALVVTFLPIYGASVLREDPLCGLHLASAFLSPIVLHFITILLDKLIANRCSPTAKMRIFNSVGFCLSACFLIALAILPPNEFFIQRSRLIWTVVMMPLGFTTVGFIYSAVIYGRFFTQHILFGLQLPFSLAFIIVPAVVVILTGDNHLRFWRLSFLLVAVTLIVCNIIFALLVSGEPAAWAEESWDPAAQRKMRNIELVSRNDECGLMELRPLSDSE